MDERLSCCAVDGPARRASSQRPPLSQRPGWILLALLVAPSPLYAGYRRRSLAQAVQVLQAAFTSTIARGLSLVAIVVGGLMFAFGEGQSKRTSRASSLASARLSEPWVYGLVVPIKEFMEFLPWFAITNASRLPRHQQTPHVGSGTTAVRSRSGDRRSHIQLLWESDRWDRNALACMGPHAGRLRAMCK